MAQTPKQIGPRREKQTIGLAQVRQEALEVLEYTAEYSDRCAYVPARPALWILREAPHNHRTDLETVQAILTILRDMTDYFEVPRASLKSAYGVSHHTRWTHKGILCGEITEYPLDRRSHRSLLELLTRAWRPGVPPEALWDRVIRSSSIELEACRAHAYTDEDIRGIFVAQSQNHSRLEPFVLVNGLGLMSRLQHIATLESRQLGRRDKLGGSVGLRLLELIKFLRKGLCENRSEAARRLTGRGYIAATSDSEKQG